VDVRRLPATRSRFLLLALAFVSIAAVLFPSAALARPTKQQLRVNIGTMPSSLDPGRAAYIEDLVVQNALFAPLYRSAGGSSGRLVPFLANGQPRVLLGGRRYLVQLRAARWSDGRPIRAADVVFAFNRARRGSPYGSEFGQVMSVGALGQRTVRFDLREPVPWFGELLASNVTAPVPSHVVRKHGNRWTNLNKLVVSGPFRVKSGRGRSELVLVPNERWWGAKRVRLQELKLLAVTQASASPLFRANRLDATLRDTSIHPSTLETWKLDPRFRTVPTGAAQYLFFNTQSPALANPAVRRGIALAIDRTALTELTSQGVDRPLASIVPEGIRGFSAVVPAGSTLLRENGAASSGDAADQLAAGGWVRGTRLQLYFADDDGRADLVAGAIRSNLAAVGVTVVLHPLTTSQIAKVGFGISPVDEGVDLVLQGWQPDYSDPQSFHQLFRCDAIGMGLNVANFCSAEYDAAATLAASSTGAARITAIRATEQLLSGPDGLMPAVPLYAPTGDHLVQRWVDGFVQQPSGRVDFERISIRRH
jgi:oligopeptide transport system substrate-binding protein